MTIKKITQEEKLSEISNENEISYREIKFDSSITIKDNTTSGDEEDESSEETEDERILRTPMEYYAQNKDSQDINLYNGEGGVHVIRTDVDSSKQNYYFWIEELKNWCLYVGSQNFLRLYCWNGYDGWDSFRSMMEESKLSKYDYKDLKIECRKIDETLPTLEEIKESDEYKAAEEEKDDEKIDRLLSSRRIATETNLKLDYSSGIFETKDSNYVTILISKTDSNNKTLIIDEAYVTQESDKKYYINEEYRFSATKSKYEVTRYGTGYQLLNNISERISIKKLKEFLDNHNVKIGSLNNKILNILNNYYFYFKLDHKWCGQIDFSNINESSKYYIRSSNTTNWNIRNITSEDEYTLSKLNDINGDYPEILKILNNSIYFSYEHKLYKDFDNDKQFNKDHLVEGYTKNNESKQHVLKTIDYSDEKEKDTRRFQIYYFISRFSTKFSNYDNISFQHLKSSNFVNAGMYVEKLNTYCYNSLSGDKKELQLNAEVLEFIKYVNEFNNSYVEDNINRGLNLRTSPFNNVFNGCPPIFRIASGELGICYLMRIPSYYNLTKQTLPIKITSDMEFINTYCQKFFGRGYEKTIEDWKNFIPKNTEDKASAVYKMSEDSMIGKRVGTVLEESEEIKMTFESPRININNIDNEEHNYVERWSNL